MFDVRALFAALLRRAPTQPAAGGDAALARGDLAAALAAYAAAEGAATENTARATFANKCGVALVRAGDRDGALAAFVRALRYDERCAAALANVGNLLYEDGHLSDAIDHYAAAIRADDGYALAHQNLGVAYKALGRHAEAVRSLRTATRLAARRRASKA